MLKRSLVLILSVLFFAGVALAGTTATNTRTADMGDGNKIYEIVVTHVMDDGNDPAEFNVSAVLAGWGRIAGGFFLGAEVVPGTGDATPVGTFDCDFDTGRGANALDITGHSATVPSYNASDDTPPVWDIQIDIGDLGNADDSVTIVIYVMK